MSFAECGLRVPGDAKVVDLSGHGLTEVPRAIFELANTLEVLDLSQNALTSLPADLGRLKRLRAIFCSGNSFTRLPPCLGDCAALSQVGFRGSGLQEIPADSLPPGLRWLTLTNNHLRELPRELGERPFLQKLMLAGNRLPRLPDSLNQAANLELLRIAANDFDVLPPWLGKLPKLAWLAWAGNPLDVATTAAPVVPVRWADLTIAEPLGEGASGRVYRAHWRTDGAPSGRAVALKLFKGTMTSDGLPASEMAACLAAGDHPSLVGALGLLADHPDGADGLVMPLLPSGSRVLAGPPSLESCSRDVYEPAARFEPDVVLRLAACIGSAAAHLHARGLLHGDLYAHNVLWDGTTGAAVLSDFGAASFMPEASTAALERLDVRAWGLLLGELIERCTDPASPALSQLRDACVQADVAARPSMAEALAALTSHIDHSV